MSKEPPCTTCLKYAICLSKLKLKCMDLVKWIAQPDPNEHIGDRIHRFETEYWNKDLAIYSTTQPEMAFKAERDHHSCIIVKVED